MRHVKQLNTQMHQHREATHSPNRLLALQAAAHPHTPHQTLTADANTRTPTQRHIQAHNVHALESSCCNGGSSHTQQEVPTKAGTHLHQTCTNAVRRRLREWAARSGQPHTHTKSMHNPRPRQEWAKAEEEQECQKAIGRLLRWVREELIRLSQHRSICAAPPAHTRPQRFQLRQQQKEQQGNTNLL